MATCKWGIDFDVDMADDGDAVKMHLKEAYRRISELERDNDIYEALICEAQRIMGVDELRLQGAESQTGLLRADNVSLRQDLDWARESLEMYRAAIGAGRAAHRHPAPGCGGDCRVGRPAHGQRRTEQRRRGALRAVETGVEEFSRGA